VYVHGRRGTGCVSVVWSGGGQGVLCPACDQPSIENNWWCEASPAVARRMLAWVARAL